MFIFMIDLGFSGRYFPIQRAINRPSMSWPPPGGEPGEDSDRVAAREGKRWLHRDGQ